MKILHVYRTYFPDPVGGVQEVIRQTALATSLLGVENKVFALSPRPSPSRLQVSGSEVIREKSWLAPASCDLGGIRSLKTFREMAEWSDIIHFHFPWPFGDLLNFFSGVQRPTLISYHSDIIRQKFLNKLYQPLCWKTLISASAIVASSPIYAQTSKILSSDFIKDKVTVIPNGVEDYANRKIDPIREKQILNKYGLEGQPFTLSIGVLRYYKGFHTLVAAAKNIHGTIVIAGNGPECERLKKQIEESNVSNVRLIGQISDEEKVVLLRRCAMFVLPSHLRSEAFGMVLVEASMFGKPMISCEIGSGTSFINQNNVTGFVIPPEEPVNMAEAINLLFSNDASFVRMGLASRARYEKYFSKEALGQSYFKLYSRII